MRKYILGVLAIVLLVFAGCKSNSNKKENEQVNNSIVRDTTVNVASLDLNKDNKVFQCSMKEHYNVISDSAGICPLCKMDLEEISVLDAQKNLLSMSSQSQMKQEHEKVEE